MVHTYVDFIRKVSVLNRTYGHTPCILITFQIYSVVSQLIGIFVSIGVGLCAYCSAHWASKYSSVLNCNLLMFFSENSSFSK